MSAPLSGIPQGIYVTTGNGQVCLNWNIVSGATGYIVNRSVDGVVYAQVGTPTANFYVDSSAVVGTQYYYQVASASAAGNSGFNSYGTNSLQLVITPCAPGQINLGYLRYQSRLRADMLKSNFSTNDEWNIMINQSKSELYDILVAKYGEDYFLAQPQIFSTSGLQLYPLPNGQNFLNTNGQPNPNGTPAPACYKVYGVDLNSYGANLSNATGWVPMSRFNFADRDKYNLLLGAASNNVAGQYCQFQYREMGTNLYIIPVNSGQYMRLWYVPISADLLLDTDMLPFSYSGWYEYVVVDVAAKALAKQEFYDQANELKQRKADLYERIEVTAANRDVGQPNTSTNSRSRLGDPNFGGGMFGNGSGGWGAGGGYGYGLVPVFMIPYLAKNYFGNEILDYAIFIGYLLLAIFSCSILFSNFFHPIPRKLIRSIFFSITTASLRKHILKIIFGRAEKEMERSNTRRIVAFVTNKYFGGDFPIKNLPGNPVCQSCLPVDLECPIAATVFPGDPRPTTARMAKCVDLVPKPFHAPQAISLRADSQ